ncbi:hypothetical protein D3C85_680900 [compost metagenome]
MVAHQQCRALVRDLLEVAVLHPVHGMAQQPDHEAHAELGDDLEDIGIDRHVQQRHHQKQLGNAQLHHAQQHDGEDRRHHHEQGIEDVVGGDHPGPLVLNGAGLDQCVQRYDVETAEYPKAQNIQQYPPGLGMA